MNYHRKRRKCNNNKYELINLKSKWFVSFKDALNQKHFVEISKEVYEAMDQFELDDIKMIHEFERHIEHSELCEKTLYKRTFYKEKSVQDIAIDNIILYELIQLINLLPCRQKKRIILYFLKELSMQEIANMEGTSHQAVSKSIKNGITKLRKMSKISYNVQ